VGEAAILTLGDVLARLEAMGTPRTVAMLRRHGVTEPAVGLSFADLTRLARHVGTAHDLALRLWATGMHDARMLATRVADPARLTARSATAWLTRCANYVITDAVALAAARMPGAVTAAVAWTRTRHEWTAAAGWIVIAVLAQRDGVDTTLAANLVARIATGLPGAPNRTRYSMNSALIALGGSMPAVRARALAAAAALGVVHVDHGATGCKTPDARVMIGKMVAHQAAKRATARQPAAATRLTSRRRPAAATSRRTTPATPRRTTSAKKAQ
jgi:3-methyladenine DNA glycosylase AlkD